jgi:putative ATP-dependent endonuclease of OLD family
MPTGLSVAPRHCERYRTAVLRDDDKKPTESVERAFQGTGGKVFAWREGRALEDELFLSLTDDAVSKLIDYATELHGKDLIDEHIKSASEHKQDLDDIQCDALFGLLSPESRAILGKAARTRKAGWFKSVTWMQEAASRVVGPDLANADAGFRAIVEIIFDWTGGSR